MGRMSRKTAAAALGLWSLAACAQDASFDVVRVASVPLGSGVPVAGGIAEPSIADRVAEGEYHVPGYMPGHPTAAMLWPRVVYVPCKRTEARGALSCAGYEISPLRGEYVYLRPLVETATPPRPPVPRPAPPVPKRPLE